MRTALENYQRYAKDRGLRLPAQLDEMRMRALARDPDGRAKYLRRMKELWQAEIDEDDEDENEDEEDQKSA